MAMVQLKCPETGKPIDIGDAPPERLNMPTASAKTSREIPCPHCGKGHIWTSSHLAHALMAFRDTPDATRLLVETTQDGPSATALP